METIWEEFRVTGRKPYIETGERVEMEWQLSARPHHEADLLEQETLVGDEETDLVDPDEDRRETPEAATRSQDQVD